MADKRDEKGGRNGNEQESSMEKDGTSKKKEEPEKKRTRGRAKKEEEEKGKKEAECMKNFLKTGKATIGEARIEKGNELERTPVKKIARAEDDKAGSQIEGDQRSSGDSGSDEEQRVSSEQSRQEEQKREEDAGAKASLGKENEVRVVGDMDERVSASVREWFRSVNNRLIRLESRLERELICKGEREKEIERLKLVVECKERELDIMKNEIKDLAMQGDIDRQKSSEIENRIVELENREIKETGGKQNRIDSERGEVSDLIILKDWEGEGCEAEVGFVGDSKGIETESSSEEEVWITDREYLKEIPDALSKGEYEYEMKERGNRKKNIIVWGFRTVGRGIKEEVRNVLKYYMDIDIYIKKIRAIGGALVIEVELMQNKIDILKRKKLLKETNIWIEDDRTEREKQVQKWLEKLVAEEKGNGHETRVGYMKVSIDGVWHEWKEEEGRLVEMTFRGEGGQGKN